MSRAVKCPCGSPVCRNWLVSPQAHLQGVSFTQKEAEAIVATLDRLEGTQPQTPRMDAQPDEARVQRLAAFLYGYRWLPGTRSFLDLPVAARRQWIEDARTALDVADGTSDSAVNNPKTQREAAAAAEHEAA